MPCWNFNVLSQVKGLILNKRTPSQPMLFLTMPPCHARARFFRVSQEAGNLADDLLFLNKAVLPRGAKEGDRESFPQYISVLLPCFAAVQEL
jgi:hypothetical protein